MKALLLFPESYSLKKGFELVFENVGWHAFNLNYYKATSSIEKRINTQSFRLPHSLRRKWTKYYLEKINRWYIREFNKIDFDLVLIYNNEMLLPSTLQWLKQKNKKIAFFLGDNPLYTHTNPYNLQVLEYADAIFVPDTFWIQQLSKTGLKNIHHLLPPLPLHSYYPIEELNSGGEKEFETDVLYVGMSYNDSWGYKKARFMSCFTGTNMKIYGNKAWKKWFLQFPDLEKFFEEKKSYIPTPELNKMYNQTKIVPVDGNPGIFNGIHVRITEALAAGALPVMEWNADMDFIFEGINDLPAVKSYDEIPEMVGFYLENETTRKEMVEKMRQAYHKKYNTETVQKTMIQALGL